MGFIDYCHWAIPENIHTIPWTASQNFEGKEGRGVFELEIRRHGVRVNDYGILSGEGG